MIRLLGRTGSINVRKVLWTLREIGVPFAHEAEWGTPARPTSAPVFLALNPNGLVPVLVDEAGAVWESNTICRYLAAAFGRADLLPAGAEARAQVERWMDWQATDLNTAWRPAFMGLVRRDPRFADPTGIERSAQNWNRLMGVLDGQLARAGDYVCGRTFTLADIVLGVSAHRWSMTPIARPALPHVRAWFARLKARPAANVALLDRVSVAPQT
ncbi:MAG: glutathione S-transferase N-terminal domain-containing protein [Rhodospirillaceae bacterium]|nr:glutathione S-transferase N-terminal domain-containing protein [Rhodospirillaceae bacterium]